MIQKMEFMDVQLQEYKKQIEENKKAHEAILKAFENSTCESSNRFDAGKLSELRDTHKKDIKTLEFELEN